MDIRDRSLRLFTFLRQFCELRMKTVRTLEQYEQIIWLSDIPQEQGCYCIAWNPSASTTKEIWVEIQKPQLKSYPKVPLELQPWLVLKHVEDSQRDFPELLESISVEETVEGENGSPAKQVVTLYLVDHPEIKKIWESYVEEKWWPWALEDRILRRVQKVYASIFTLYQHQQRLGEAYEIVLGMGYLTWKTPCEQNVKRHLIVAQTAISFEAERGKITIGPSAEGAMPALEQDMLEPEEQPDFNELRAIEQLIADMGDAIWEEDRIHTILKSWIHTIPDSREYNKSLAHQQEAPKTAQVHFAPAIILRKRTERSLVRVFKEITSQLQDTNNPIPKGIYDIVKNPETAPHMDQEPDGERVLPTGLDEIYFPLPSNKEQQEIARQIATKQGVLVQGPPGTGKSHTIVNLVCHLLATGKRVLVTSHTTRALIVLRDKFPEEIAPLCVIALGDDMKSMKGLESSVKGITERHNYWNPDQNQRQIERCEAEIDRARREEARIFRELCAIRESETYCHSTGFGDYKGTMQSIARRLYDEEQTYNWISASPGEEDEPPFTDAEALELLTLLRQFDGDREFELHQKIFDPQLLVSPNVFSAFVAQEEEAYKRYKECSSICKRIEYGPLLACDKAKRLLFIETLVNLQKAFEKLTQNIQPWVKKIAVQILAGEEQSFIELLDVTQQYLDLIGDKARRVSELNITGLGNRERNIVKSNAAAILQHFEAGGKLGFWKIRPKAVSDGMYLIQEVRVNGRLCDAPEPLHALLEWIDVANYFDVLDSYWQTYTTPSISAYSIRKADYENKYTLLSNCLNLSMYRTKAKEAIASIPGLKEPIWHDINSISELEETAKKVELEVALHKIQQKFEGMIDGIKDASLDPICHPACRKVVEAIKSRDKALYNDIYFLLNNLRKSMERLKKREDLMSRLENIAKPLADDLRAAFVEDIWDKRLSKFAAAWNWARAERWIKRLSDPLEQQRLEKNLDIQRQNIQKLIAELAAAKAWRYCLSRLTEHESGHLRAWQLAVRRIGRGTGPHANEHRRAARQNMEECRSAIPAWIMPIYRVAETIDIKPDIFDVVIVDEASQSGPEALFLQYIAKTIVVVGDHKQISPQFVGIDKQAVALLRDRFIPDLPYNDALGVDNSFFDQAFIRYTGQICLQEHFRCMPEIIQFSNNLCYSEMPLIPLKQYGAGRLTPTVVTKSVSDGYQKGRSQRITNPPEAEAIADYISKLCADERYSGKTMGVISLLGEEQAKLIHTLLSERVGPIETEKRSLHCGDAYAFQGDERDIIFLSMVSAPGDDHRIGTLTGGNAEKRFNVACSRAREQMFLFCSVSLNDLSPMCLRYRLLEYCQNPKIEQTTISGINVEQLRIVSQTAKRYEDTPPQPFDSWFEVDVFLQIANRGYRVIPQLEVAGYRIDLIVEGMQGRLAVECDGDKWHGPERYLEDAARQRQLERGKFKFWRVRGSVYYRDPERAMESLWQTLQQLQIFPKGQEYKDEDAACGNKCSSSFIELKSKQMKDCDSKEECTQEQTLDNPPSENKTEGDTENNETELTEDAAESFIPTIDQNLINRIGEPYKIWKLKPLPDPRNGNLSEISKGLIEIIKGEGPIICHRVYRIYVAAVGIQRITRQIKSNFNKAMRKAIVSKAVLENNEYGQQDQINKIVRVNGCPPVIVRTRGDRTISEIPPMEIAEVMRAVIAKAPHLENNLENIFREVLHNYDLVRLTSNTRSVLEIAFEIYDKTKKLSFIYPKSR